MYRETIDPIDLFVSAAGSNEAIVLTSVAVPMAMALALNIAYPQSKTQFGGVTLSTVWNAVWLLAGNELAVWAGWWSFGSAGPTVANTPVALWIGWVILWGPVAAQSPFRPRTTLGFLAALDLLLMPHMGDVVHLSDSWLIGEATLLVFVALPGLLLVAWTRDRARLGPYVILQVVLFAGMLGWAIPQLSTPSRGLHISIHPTGFGVVLFCLGLASLPGLTAVSDFYQNGGSPWPWDWTERPVRSGPYRYLRSPMQLSAMAVLTVMAVLYQSPAVLAAAASAVFYARLFSLAEGRDLTERFGSEWSDLTLAQRHWIPTLRPSGAAEPATVWIDSSCDVCSPIARFLQHRAPVGLDIRPAAEHTETLTRLRYERADGVVLRGVAGVGATLEHLHLGWAVLGWLLRAPVLWRAWQTIGDAVGFGPRPAPRSAPHKLSSASD